LGNEKQQQSYIWLILMHATTFSFRESVGIGMMAVTLLCQSNMHQGIIQ